MNAPSFALRARITRQTETGAIFRRYQCTSSESLELCHIKSKVFPERWLLIRLTKAGSYPISKHRTRTAAETAARRCTGA